MTNTLSKAAVDRAKDLVQAAFPGAAMISIHLAAQFLGLSEKTLRNMIAGSRSPVGTAKVGGRRLIPADALAMTMAKALESAGVFDTTPQSLTVCREPGGSIGEGPGRPRKTESIAAAQAGMSVRARRQLAGVQS